jgi:hypothetical protein
MERARWVIRLLATVVLGLAALGVLVLLSASISSHHFKLDAQHAIRHVFTEGGGTAQGIDYVVTCRPTGAEGEDASPCDALAIKGADLFRSGTCTDTLRFSFLGNQWACLARFKDGSTLPLEVSVGLGSRHLQVLLPGREPDA